MLPTALVYDGKHRVRDTVHRSEVQSRWGRHHASVHRTIEKTAVFYVERVCRLDVFTASEVAGRADGKGESVLEGRLRDQAALTGGLNTLYALHLPVMAVDCPAGPEK